MSTLTNFLKRKLTLSKPEHDCRNMVFQKAINKIVSIPYLTKIQSEFKTHHMDYKMIIDKRIVVLKIRKSNTELDRCKTFQSCIELLDTAETTIPEIHDVIKAKCETLEAIEAKESIKNHDIPIQILEIKLGTTLFESAHSVFKNEISRIRNQDSIEKAEDDPRTIEELQAEKTRYKTFSPESLELLRVIMAKTRIDAIKRIGETSTLTELKKLSSEYHITTLFRENPEIEKGYHKKFKELFFNELNNL